MNNAVHRGGVSVTVTVTVRAWVGQTFAVNVQVETGVLVRDDGASGANEVVGAGEGSGEVAGGGVVAVALVTVDGVDDERCPRGGLTVGQILCLKTHRVSGHVCNSSEWKLTIC